MVTNGRALGLLSRRYRSFAGLAALAGVVLVVAFEPGLFRGSRLIGFDAASLVTPWYLNALLAFYHGPFVALNPYQMGGMPNFNLLANYDPIYVVPAIVRAVPSMYQVQLLILVHLFFIPICLVALARLYGVTGLKLILAGVLGAVAAYTGFDLKYMETTEAIDGYSWSLLALTAIEYYRVRKGVAFAVIAALALDFAFMRFAKGLALWPLFIVAYVATFWDQFKHRHLLRDVALAGVVFVLVLAPCIVQQSHLWGLIETSKDFSLEQEGTLQNALSYFGFFLAAHTSEGQDVFVIAGIITVMGILGFANMDDRERWFFGISLVLLFAYVLGDVTPMQSIVRHLYPPVDPFRRAYEAFYIPFALLLLVVVRFAIADPRSRSADKTWSIATGAVFVAVAAVAIALDRSTWLINLAVLACAIIFIVYRQPVVAALLLVVQWLLVGYLPIAHSPFYPKPAAGVVGDIASQYRDLEPYLALAGSDSTRLYRVVGVGVDATFGSWAGVYQFYNLAPDTGTRIPQALYERTQIADPLSDGIVDSLRQRPDIIAGPAMRDMAVRHYLFSDDASDIARAAERRHPELRALHAANWTVLEDPKAHAFVSTVGARPLPVAAHVGWDTVSFVMPAGASAADVAFLYDPWWRATTGGRPATIVDNSGQLRVSASGVQGKLVELRYGSEIFTTAIMLQMIAYGAIAAAALAWLVLSRRRAL